MDPSLIHRLAREAGIWSGNETSRIERFAALVAEDLAKLVEAHMPETERECGAQAAGQLEFCAQAIRERFKP